MKGWGAGSQARFHTWEGSHGSSTPRHQEGRQKLSRFSNQTWEMQEALSPSLLSDWLLAMTRARQILHKLNFNFFDFYELELLRLSIYITGSESRLFYGNNTRQFFDSLDLKKNQTGIWHQMLFLWPDSCQLFTFFFHPLKEEEKKLETSELTVFRAQAWGSFCLNTWSTDLNCGSREDWRSLHPSWSWGDPW